MENVYSAYTKVINDVTFYFVKKYASFPEYKDLPQVLETMGMHTDFYRACDIAQVYDEVIINQLLDDLHILPESARVITMGPKKSITHTLLKNTHHVISKFRLAGIN
jgi:hypothetical protein